jgi:hypothetical protein
MQPGFDYVNRGINSQPTSGEPIEVDQRSIRSLNNDPDNAARFLPNPASTTPLYPQRALPMGQSASAPNDESRNHPSSDATRRQDDGRQPRRPQHPQQGQLQGTEDGGEDGDINPERIAAVAARLRRSRRLRNHIEHFARLGDRLMPTASSSISASSSATARNRVPGLRFRSRTARLSRSRSPSPPRGNGRNDASSPRRRTIPSISNPIPIPGHGYEDSHPVHHDMMDISPAASVAPQQNVEPSSAAPQARRSRISRIRDSISSWPDLMSSELGSIISRPSSRRPSDIPRPGVIDAISHGNHSAMSIEQPGPQEAASPVERESRGPVAERAASLLPPGLLERGRPGEDQAAMLSRLLSVAAAATAASLVGNAEEAITQAQDVAGDNGGDGSFESFLRALQNGRLEAALRNGGNEMGGGASEGNRETGMTSLNFFRMFRFGSTPARDEGEASAEGDGGDEPPRMVPVIIVGIRSVSPRDSEGEGNQRPQPFFDALANLPVTPSPLRRTRYSNRRSDSAGERAEGAAPSTRHSPSTTSDFLSALNSLQAARSESASRATSSTGTASPSSNSNRRSTVESILEEDGRDQDTTGQQESSRSRTPRRLSTPDTGSPFTVNYNDGTEGAARDRRNSGSATRPPEGTRSWIIYVLGGQYPENHPILTTPSLFTDVSDLIPWVYAHALTILQEPTYEDMTLLSSLLGPAKLPVVAREDLEGIGGVFTFGDGSVPIEAFPERCPICLSDYEEGNDCRQLLKCSHIFHKECIDEVGCCVLLVSTVLIIAVVNHRPKFLPPMSCRRSGKEG